MMGTERVEINPEILGGKPVIKGTRIPVSHVIQMIRSGKPTQNILEEYPELSSEDVESIKFYAR